MVNTRKPFASLYSNSAYSSVEGLMRMPPGRYGHRHGEIDPIAQQLGRLKEERSRQGHRQTLEHRTQTKAAIIGLLRTLIDTTPRPINTMQSLIDEASPRTLSDILDALESVEQQARFETNATQHRNLTEQSYSLVRELVIALRAQRDLVQPIRPRLKPTHQAYEFSQINIELYAPFVRAFAAASAVDRSTDKGRRMLSRLPNLDYVGRETQGFCALLTFSEAIKGVLKQCEGKNQPPQSYWNTHREQLQSQLRQARETFDQTIALLQLTVRADSIHYHQCVEAMNNVVQATSYATAKNAQDALKHHAFLYVLGGEDKEKGKPAQKLLTRISNAYRADRKAYMTRVEDNPDHLTPPNPLDNPLHLINRAYEARWAIAAASLAGLVDSYDKTMADPAIGAGADVPPQETSVTEITRRGRSHASRVASHRASTRVVARA